MSFIRGLGLHNVQFEMDAKTIVDVVRSPDSHNSEFGSIIAACKDLMKLYPNFSVSFFSC